MIVENRIKKKEKKIDVNDYADYDENCQICLLTLVCVEKFVNETKTVGPNSNYISVFFLETFLVLLNIACQRKSSNKVC